MGKLIISKKSDCKQFQIAFWENPWGISATIKKFKRESDGKVNFYNFGEINFVSEQEFDKFIAWIKTIGKKKK